MAAAASPEASTTASTRQRAATSAGAGDRAGRWPDRFATYGSIYCYPHHLASDPFSFGMGASLAAAVAVAAFVAGGTMAKAQDGSGGSRTLPPLLP